MNLFFVPQKVNINDKQFIEDHDTTYGAECIRGDNCAGLYAASLIHLSELNHLGELTKNHSEGIYRTRCRYCGQYNDMAQKDINPQIDWNSAIPSELKAQLPDDLIDQLGQPNTPGDALRSIPKAAMPVLNVNRFSLVWNGVQHSDHCPFSDFEFHEKAVPTSAGSAESGHERTSLTASGQNFGDMPFTPSPKLRQLPDREYKALTQDFFDLRKSKRAA